MQLDMNIKETTDCFFFFFYREGPGGTVANRWRTADTGIYLVLYFSTFIFFIYERIDSCLDACGEATIGEK